MKKLTFKEVYLTRVASGQQLAKIWGPQAHRELNPAKNYMSLDHGSFPSQASEETPALTATSIAALWEMFQMPD